MNTQQFTGAKDHCYIPLLAVNPNFQKRGHGLTIVDFLVAEAAGIAQKNSNVSNLLFLDVYTANQAAVSLYDKSGFDTLNRDAPLADPQESNETYVIMAKKLAIPAPMGTRARPTSVKRRST